jgi:nitrogen regulation protein NR(I)
MTKPLEVWVVDDDASIRWVLERALRQAGLSPVTFDHADAALATLATRRPDVLLTDVRMPGTEGLHLLEIARRDHPGLPVIVMTAHSDLDHAVAAYRGGAFEYLPKPFDIDEAVALVRRAAAPGTDLAASDAGAAIPGILGQAPAMQEVFRAIGRLSRSSLSVLVTGESGTGKELVARALHRHSPRANAPFIALNTSALASDLLESELFGHERGAFTGADAQRIGRFESAHGGTLLLDEISEIDPRLQAKLLRVLQEKSFERVGSSQTIHVDVRVLATTNRDLHEEVAAGRFREDLYFRLAVVPLAVPPLRERREDIPELCDFFFARSAIRLQREPCTLDASARQLLFDYHWPGNVRELENIVTRSSILSSGKPVSADELRRWLIASPPSQTVKMSVIPTELSLEEMERKLIESTLERFGGHRAKTAEALGIGLRTLSGKLRQYGYAPREKCFSKVG